VLFYKTDNFTITKYILIERMKGKKKKREDKVIAASSVS
jgi:hypothetical protein